MHKFRSPVLALLVSVLLFAVVALPALAVEPFPTYAAGKLGTGMLRLWSTSISSPEGLTYLRVASVDTSKFSLWMLNSAGTGYVKLGPARSGGTTSAVDSLIVLLPGQVFETTIPSPGVIGLYFTQGDAYIRGH